MKPLRSFIGMAVLSAMACSSTPKDANEMDGHGGASGAPSQGAVGGAGGAVTTGPCSYMGQTYPEGATFPDGPEGARCAACYCIEGQVACATVDCSCRLGPLNSQESLSFGQVGHEVAYVDRASLSSTGVYSYSRTPTGATTPSASCMPSLPICRGVALDINDVRLDLEDADVRLALSAATPTLFGFDSRQLDGTVFEVQRSTGGSLLVGGDCGSDSSCRPVPAGIAKLVADLRALNAQQLADPSCSALVN
jgi:hypothetical protein